MDIGGANTKAALLKFEDKKIVDTYSYMEYFPFWEKTIIEIPKLLKRVVENLVKKNNIKLKVFENFTFYPPIMRAKVLLDEGVIGQVNSIHIKTIEGTKGGWDISTTT